MESLFEMKMFNVWGSINLRLKRTVIDIKLTINSHQLNENIACLRSGIGCFLLLTFKLSTNFTFQWAKLCTEVHTTTAHTTLPINLTEWCWSFDYDNYCAREMISFCCYCCSFIELFQLYKLQWLFKSSKLKHLISKAEKNVQMNFMQKVEKLHPFL